MAELPVLPLKTEAILADCSHMTAEQFGAYCRLLFAMWLHGGMLVENEDELARICGLTGKVWRKNREAILRPMTIIGGRVSQKRLTDTWMKVQEKRRKTAMAAGTRWNRRH